MNRSVRRAVVTAWLACGIVYGVFWLLVMYRGVIPALAAVRPLYIAHAPKRPLPDVWPLPFFVHIVCVGLPISLAIGRAPMPAARPSGQG